MATRLPIDDHLDEIVATVRRSRRLVLVAPPGSGKTTRVPPALIDDGPLILLQPRRVAARALARRIAEERGWTIGREIGWHIRFERRFARDTRLLVATEGILTARLASDPLLEGVRTIVLDEFHERSLHADVALALARQALDARDDLRLVVMSATLDAGRVARFLDDAPVIEVPGRTHPLEIEHAPHESLEDAVIRRFEAGTERGDGHVLAFLPGAREIDRAVAAISARLRGAADVLPLHGSLDAAAQDRALRDSGRRRVIVATNIAETSLTVEGVTDVVDAGQHKVMRLDPRIGLDRLVLERIPRDAADQRAGRAGRTGPGHAVRLWDARDVLAPHREPEIARVDLAAPFLEVLAWGEDPRTFAWFEAPDPERAALALALLEALGAVDAGKLTPLGAAMRRLPLPPRLARVALAARPGRGVARACVLLAEGWNPPTEPLVTSCDLLPRLDRWREAPRRLDQAHRQIRARLDELDASGAWPADARLDTDLDDEAALRRALAAGYPDRIAERREPGSPRVRLASGHGAELAAESGVRAGELLVALDLQAAPHGSTRPSRIRLASTVERDWLHETSRSVEHELRPDSGKVVATERRRYHELTLSRHPTAADDEIAATLLRDALKQRVDDGRSLGETADRLLARLSFAGIEFDLSAALLDACRARGNRGWFDPNLLDALTWEQRETLKCEAPETLPIPSGRNIRLDYRDADTVVAAAKLQELFGLAESPRLGQRRIPVTFELLAPSGRPVQTTRDLRSFWNNGYPEVRKELRGRYPKHPWPEDPWTAEATARTKRRPRGR